MTTDPSASSPTDKAIASTPHIAQYQVTPQMKQFWASLFHSQITDKEAAQLTDGFVRNIVDRMNHVMKWALQQQKERHAREREQERGQ